MTLGQGHDTPLDHGQLLCEELSRSYMAVRSYGLDMDFRYLCTVTLTLDMTLDQGHDTHLKPDIVKRVFLTWTASG